MNTRDFCKENDHALVDPAIETRDSLGVLAVAILSNDPEFQRMSSDTKIISLFNILKDLQNSYLSCLEHGELSL